MPTSRIARLLYILVVILSVEEIIHQLVDGFPTMIPISLITVFHGHLIVPNWCRISSTHRIIDTLHEACKHVSFHWILVHFQSLLATLGFSMVRSEIAAHPRIAKLIRLKKIPLDKTYHIID